jgi:hypothetical protein
MRRHVILPFCHMLKPWVAVRDQPGHVTLQIGPDIRIRIFTQDERGTGVMEKDIADTGPDTGAAHTLLDLAGYQTGATPAGGYKKVILENH